MAKSVGDFVSGRRPPRAIDPDIFRQQSSAIDYGDGYIATHVLSHMAQIDFGGVVFPPPTRGACPQGYTSQQLPVADGAPKRMGHPITMSRLGGRQ